MAWFSSPLDDVRVAAPCPANWDEMYGDDRRRFCGDCKLNVYNISGMTREEAERLITNSEGRLCVRFFRRRDGSVITADCPVGWARVKQKTRRHLTAAFSMIAALLTGTFAASYFSSNRDSVTGDAVAGMMAIPTASPSPTLMNPQEHLGGLEVGVMVNTKPIVEKAPVEMPRRTLRKIAEID